MSGCRTKAVVSACHVLTTLELAAGALPPALTERARRAVRVGNGIGVALRLGHDEPSRATRMRLTTSTPDSGCWRPTGSMLVQRPTATTSPAGHRRIPRSS